MKGWENNVKELLKFEMRKLKKQKSFYICTTVMIALLLLSFLTTHALIKSAPDLESSLASPGVHSALNSLGNSSFLLIAGIFTALNVCEDYEQQTVKNIFSRGYSRKNLYFAKAVTVWIGTSIMFAVVQITAFVLGTAYFGVGDTGNFRFLLLIAVQYITAMANISLFFALSSVFRKNGSSIAATIVAPMLISMVLSLLDSFRKSDRFSFSDFWLSSFLSDLSSPTVSGSRLAVCLSVSLLYLIVFLVPGLQSCKKSDL